MFKSVFFVLLTIFTGGLANGQELSTAHANPVTQPDAVKSYIVKITEYQLDQPIDSERSVAEILAALTENNAESKSRVMETIRFSALSGSESMVSFGRTINMLVGTSNTGRGEVRSLQGVDTGTIVRALASPSGNKVAVKITYESSRLDASDSKDLPGNLRKTKISVTQLLEPGKPALLGSSTSAHSNVIVISIIPE